MRCPELTPVSPLLAGHFLVAGCMSGMELELCWRANVSDAGIQAVEQTTVTTTISDPLAFLKGQHLFNTWGQRSWEGAWGNLLCSKYGSLLSHWKLLMRPNKWNLKEIRHGDLASGCGIDTCSTPPWGEILNIRSWGSWRLVGSSSNTTADGQSSSVALFLHSHFNEKRRK